ncbi:Hsp20 family protein [Virgibacillus sp. C22-A2]|uniref:Hsp20 family protein n=1 Tax=Virgibacillus tibetensis TaxID=3042313 RepID=A0ABU6KI58_9BACI|nr:Hsp20 family protein [Virgibacillus sp. C22-A2]
MNKYWPKAWKEKMPNFLGEDFFTSFENFEENDMENASTNNTVSNSSNNHNYSSVKVNICESNNELLCIFRIPGLKLEEVDIDVYDMTLEIVGYVTIDHKGFSPIQLELYQGPVKRKIKLPYPARHDKINATYRHGYLYVHLHRLIRTRETKKTLDVHDLDVE